MLLCNHSHSSSIRINFRLHSLLVILYKTYCMSNMASPFLKDPVEEEAAELCRELHRRQESILRLRLHVLSFFHLQLLTYLHVLNCPHITKVTHRGCAPTSEQIFCVASQTGVLLCNICDAKHISGVSRAARDIICHNHFTDEPSPPPREVK